MLIYVVCVYDSMIICIYMCIYTCIYLMCIYHHHHHCTFGIVFSWNAQHYGKCFTVYPVLTNQLCQSYFEGETPPPISTFWGSYSSAASHGAHHF